MIQSLKASEQSIHLTYITIFTEMKGDTKNKIYKKNFGIFEGTISARLFIF